jgi:hypothetical protein
VIRQAAPHAQDMTCRRTKFKSYVDQEAKRKNTTKARVRAKVEHPFRILKRIFGFDKVKYRGISKNHNRLCVCFALVNLYLHRKTAGPAPGVVGPKLGIRLPQTPTEPKYRAVPIGFAQKLPAHFSIRSVTVKSGTCAEVP